MSDWESASNLMIKSATSPRALILVTLFLCAENPQYSQDGPHR
jgi:hypothetical protein